MSIYTIKVKLKQFYWSIDFSEMLGSWRHDSAVVSAAALQQEGPRFNINLSM